FPNHVLLGFWPFRAEPSVEAVWRDLTKSHLVGLPVVAAKTGHMDFRVLGHEDKLVKNRYGIMEPPPTAHPVELTTSCLMFIPCVAADKKGRRLGYGGGYYDRFLINHPKIKKVGVLFRQFFYPDIPYETHDQLLDAVLTETGVTQILLAD